MQTEAESLFWDALPIFDTVGQATTLEHKLKKLFLLLFQLQHTICQAQGK